MANTGYILPQTASTTSETGWADSGGAWQTPNAIYGAGEASITDNAFDNGDASHVLRGYNFNLSAVPAGATINGIVCRVMARATNPTTAIGLAQLLNTSNARVGTNLASTPITITGTMTAAEHIIGASNNNWGNALTATWVKNSNFGVGIGVLNGANNADVFIDSIEIDVYYTDATINVTPSTGVLTFTGYAPTVFASDKKEVAPGTGELTATGYAPTIAVSNNITVNPLTGELVITGFAPTVTVTNNVVINPLTGELTITGFAPTVVATNNISVTPGTGELVFTGFAPIVTITGLTKYLVTKGGKYVTYNGKLLIINSEAEGDIIMVQEGVDGKYTEVLLTFTQTPPTFE